MKKVLNVFALAAATGVFVAPAWAQERPSSKQSTSPSGYSGRVESGEDQNVPPAAGQFGRSGMSKDEIKKVEEALQAKGHNPGRVDGVMDNQTQAAIRDFQKANSLAITGTLDQQTAQKLGVSLSQQSGGMPGDKPKASTERSRSGAGYSGPVQSGEDQNVPPGGEIKQSPR